MNAATLSRRDLMGLSAASLAGCGGGSGPQEKIQAAPAPQEDTTTLQALIDATTEGGTFHLTAGTYYVSTLTLRKPIRFVGDGPKATIIVSSADEAVVAAPDAPVSQGYFLEVSQLGIRPAVAGAGKSALVLRVKTGTFISNFTVSHCYLGDFGGPGLLLDNSAGNGDGIFCGEIGPRNWICNGVKGIGVGDSVSIFSGTITDGVSVRGGTRPGLPGIDITTVDGSAMLTVSGLNITTSGGAIHIRNALQPQVEKNIVEHPTYYGTPYAGPAGMIQLTNVVKARVVGNAVNINGTAPYALAFDGGELNSITDNNLGAGVQGHLAFLAGSSRNKLSGLNTYRGGADETVGRITGAATGLLP